MYFEIDYSIIDPVLRIGACLILVALFIAFWRIWRGPDIVDRVIALDLVAGLALAAVIIIAIQAKNSLFLDVAIAISLISFLGTVAVSRYLEKREEGDDS